MYGDTGITEMDMTTESTYLGDSGIDRYHLNIQMTHSIIPSSWSNTLLPSFHRFTQLG